VFPLDALVWCNDGKPGLLGLAAKAKGGFVEEQQVQNRPAETR